MDVSCTTAFVSPVFFVRWHEVTAEAIRRVNEELAEAHRALGKPVVFVAIVSPDCKLPDSRARAAMVAGSNDVKDICASMHVVIEGHGIDHSLQRIAFTMMAFLAIRKDIFVHDSVMEALAKAVWRSPEMGIEPLAVLVGAAKHKIVPASISEPPDSANN